MWPQRLGKTWSSIFTPATPIAISRSVMSAAFKRIAAARVDVGHDGDLHGPGDVPGVGKNVVHIHQTDVRFGEQAAGQTEAAYLDRFETCALDDASAQGIMTAGHNQGPALR